MTLTTKQSASRTLASRAILSPVGPLTLVASPAGLVAVLWPEDRPGRVPLEAATEDPANPFLAHAKHQLQEYFEGRRTRFTVPLDLRGTGFQLQVWQALTGIPFGETRTYAQIARQLGNPNATRAVGAANSRNPVSILVPCHRVIGSSGKLTGFAGGVNAKAYLLNLEVSRTEFCLV